MDITVTDVTDPAFYDSTYYAAMDLRYLNNIHSGRIRAIKKILPLVKGKRTLDVGCGGGGVTDVYGGATKDLVAIDFSRSAIDFAKKRFPGPEFRVMDVFKLHENFKNGEFDVVIANDVIEHVYDHDDFFENCKAVMAQDGYLIVTTDLDDQPWTRSKLLWLLRAMLLPFGWDGLRFLMLRILELPRDRIKNYHECHIKTLSQDELLALLKKHGFTIERTLVYNLTHGYIRDFVLDLIRIVTRLELRDHQLIVARLRSA